MRYGILSRTQVSTNKEGNRASQKGTGKHTLSMIQLDNLFLDPL